MCGFSQDECCGFNNYSDWMQLEWGKNMTVPTSCCNSTETNNTILCTGDLTDKGQLHLIYRKASGGILVTRSRC